MLSVEPFRPVPNGTVSISANGTAFGTAILATAGDPTNISVRVHNAGPSIGFVEFGGVSNTTASASASMPMPVGAIEVLSIDQCAYASAICASGQTATIYFTRGYGL